MSEPKSAYDLAREGLGFPRFAQGFPRDEELDALVVAYVKGDYLTVRNGAPALAAKASDPEVVLAAKKLRAHIDADPTAKLLFLVTAALLLFLTGWWVAHDGPDQGAGGRLRAPSASSATSGSEK